MSDLKHSHYIPILPLSISKANDSPWRQAPLDQAYLMHLKQELIKIMTSLHYNIDDIGHKYIKKEEHQKIIQQKQQLISNLVQENAIMQNEMFQAKIKIQQLQRFTKRFKMNEELLNNNILHLKKTVSEKQAIIKYLEEKKQKMQKYSSKGGILSESISQDFSRTYSKANLSFAKLKPSNNPKFQDFSNCSLRFDEQESFGNQPKGRSNRIKTQSTELKENDQSDNIKSNLSIRKLKDFFKLGLQNNLQNQKTLTKTNLSQTNGSLWQFASSKNQGLDPQDRRRLSNFNSSNCLGMNSSECGIKR